MNKTIEELRKQIDDIDKKIIELLSKRMDVVKEIGKIKREVGKEVLDETRWNQVIEKLQNNANNFQLDFSFIKTIFQIIHEHAKKLQETI